MPPKEEEGESLQKMFHKPDKVTAERIIESKLNKANKDAKISETKTVMEKGLEKALTKADEADANEFEVAGKAGEDPDEVVKNALDKNDKALEKEVKQLNKQEKDLKKYDRQIKEQTVQKEEIEKATEDILNNE